MLQIRTVGRYEILREVGRGAMGIVYVARQADLGREIALKELPAGLATEPGFAARFVRESRIVASLSHPNVVTVYEYFEHDNAAFIAMEYLERGSLRPFVGALSLPQVAGVLEGLLAGLGHAAARGVVHRDLKPENLLISDEGAVKIGDFGIAQIVAGDEPERHPTHTAIGAGTPAYMAPEQVLGEPVGPWTDIYATGVIAYELLLGRPPFGQAGVPWPALMSHANDAPPSPRSIDPAFDPRLASWLERMLAKQPADRPQSASAAWEELEDIVGDLDGPRWRRGAPLGDERPAAAAIPRRLAAAAPSPEMVTAAPRSAASRPASARRTGVRGIAVIAAMLGAFAAAFFGARALAGDDAGRRSAATGVTSQVGAVAVPLDVRTTKDRVAPATGQIPALQPPPPPPPVPPTGPVTSPGHSVSPPAAPPAPPAPQPSPPGPAGGINGDT